MNPYQPPATSPTPSPASGKHYQFKLFDCFIFLTVATLTMATMPSQVEPDFPAWARYSACGLYAAFVTLWSWLLDLKFEFGEVKYGFVGRLLMVSIYFFFTVVVGYDTSLCILYPCGLSLLVVPIGLLFYVLSLQPLVEDWRF